MSTLIKEKQTDYSVVSGDPVHMMLSEQFDVLINLVDCTSNHDVGAAKAIEAAFGTSNYVNYVLEGPEYVNDLDKLGRIEESHVGTFIKEGAFVTNYVTPENAKRIHIVNAYVSPTFKQGIDYNAYALCLKKISYKYGVKKMLITILGKHRIVGKMATAITTLKDLNMGGHFTVVIYIPHEKQTDN